MEEWNLGLKNTHTHKAKLITAASKSYVNLRKNSKTANFRKQILEAKQKYGYFKR